MSQCTIGLSRPSIAMWNNCDGKKTPTRVIDIPQRSHMVLPRVAKKSQKGKKEKKKPEMDYSTSVMAINI